MDDIDNKRRVKAKPIKIPDEFARAAKESRPAVINCQAKKEFWLRQQFPPGFLGTVEPGCMSYNH